MKKTLLIVLAGLCVAVLTVCAFVFSVRTKTVTDYAMNTLITITVKSRHPEKDAKAAIQEVKRIDYLMSTTRLSSDVAKINSARAGEEVKVCKEVYSLIELAVDISQKTQGAFDISINPLSVLWNINSPNPNVPKEDDIESALSKVNYKDIVLNPEKQTVMLKKDAMTISLGAIAKGYAADCAAKLLKQRSVSEAIVDLGGNIYVVGAQKTVGIQTPFKKRGEYFTSCKVCDKSVVTSGAYERYFKKEDKVYHHILNPAYGYPAYSGIKSATVISKNSALADALSTAIYVLGKDKAKELVSYFDEIEVILLTDDNEIVRIDN